VVSCRWRNVGSDPLDELAAEPFELLYRPSWRRRRIDCNDVHAASFSEIDRGLEIASADLDERETFLGAHLPGGHSRDICACCGTRRAGRCGIWTPWTRTWRERATVVSY